jgi:L-iditol 2-dehydrogenase
MQAVVKEAPGPGNVVLKDVPEPHAGPGQVRIAVRVAGICGSDLHIAQGDIKLRVQPPVVMGHEFAGVVDEVGSGVSGWRVGDRVTAETTVSTCGRCRSCRDGAYNRCPEREILGYVHDGAFAAWVVVAAERLHRVPDNVSLEEAAMTEPLACCVRAMCDVAQVHPGDLVVVAGPGPIGLLCLQLAMAAGARTVIVGVAGDEERLDVAKSLGADCALVEQGGLAERLIHELSGGEGCDLFVEASGTAGAAQLGLASLRRGGQYLQVGLAGQPFAIDLSLLAYKELKMLGSLSQVWPAWERALLLLSRRQVNVRALQTHIFALGQWEEAFRVFASKRGLKVMLRPE